MSAVRKASLLLALLVACGDDGEEPVRDAGVADAMSNDIDANVVPDAQTLDARVEDAAMAYVPPKVDFPTKKPDQPFLLSAVGLYTDIASKALAPDLIAYEPTYTLWSDGALKDRHLRLPPGEKIDNSDPDHWIFPVGTVLFKEFRTPDKRLETRVVARIGEGERDYFFGAFAWREDESDAELVWDGAMNVRGTEHDVPTNTQCGSCHNGDTGRVLGVSAVQTANLDLPLTVNRAPYTVPGTPEQAKALGYLHANCGHCHNPNGTARPDTNLALRLYVAEPTVETTTPFKSAVGQKLQSFMGGDFMIRIVAGDPAQSALLYRMGQRGVRSQMPPIATEQSDPTALQLISDFITGLPH